MTTRKRKRERKPYEYRSPFDFDCSKMTPEEVIERLRAQGIEPNQWVNNEDHVKDGDTAQLPTLKWYADILKEMGGIIEQQVEHDLRETDELGHQLARLKRGGGR